MPAHKLQDRQEFQGLQISVENAKGSTRKWYDPHGKEAGSTYMHHAYGYIRGTLGTDGDHVDVYIGPHPAAAEAYIVDQMKKPPGAIVKDGKPWDKFDEQKVMLGWNSPEAAKAAYNKQYDDPRFFGSIKAMPMDQFKEKVMSKDNHGKKVASDIMHMVAGIGADTTIGTLIGQQVGGAVAAVTDRDRIQARATGRQFGGAVGGVRSFLSEGPTVVAGAEVAKRLAKELAAAKWMGKHHLPSAARHTARATGAAALTAGALYLPEISAGVLAGLSAQAQSPVHNEIRQRNQARISKARWDGRKERIGGLFKKLTGGAAKKQEDETKKKVAALRLRLAAAKTAALKTALNPNTMREMITNGLGKRGVSLKAHEQKDIARGVMKYFGTMKREGVGHVDTKAARKKLQGVIKDIKARVPRPGASRASGAGAGAGGPSAGHTDWREAYNKARAESDAKWEEARSRYHGARARAAGDQRRQRRQQRRDHAAEQARVNAAEAAERRERSGQQRAYNMVGDLSAAGAAAGAGLWSIGVGHRGEENRKARSDFRKTRKEHSQWQKAAASAAAKHTPRADAATAASTGGLGLLGGSVGAFIGGSHRYLSSDKARGIGRGAGKGALIGAALGALGGYKGDRDQRRRTGAVRAKTQKKKEEMRGTKKANLLKTVGRTALKTGKITKAQRAAGDAIQRSNTMKPLNTFRTGAQQTADRGAKGLPQISKRKTPVQKINPVSVAAHPDPKKAIQAGRQIGMPVRGGSDVLDQLNRMSFSKLNAQEKFAYELKLAFGPNEAMLRTVGDATIGALLGNATGTLTGKVLGKYPGQSRDYGAKGGAIAGAVSSLASGNRDIKAVRAFRDIAQAAGAPRGARGAEVLRAMGRTGVAYAPEMLGGVAGATLFAHKAQRKTEAKMLTQGQRRKAKKLTGVKMSELLDNPNDPLHIPPTQRKKLTKVAEAYYSDFEYMTETEKVAVLNTLRRLGQGAIRAGRKGLGAVDDIAKRPGAYTGAKHRAAAGIKAPRSGMAGDAVQKQIAGLNAPRAAAQKQKAQGLLQRQNALSGKAAAPKAQAATKVPANKATPAGAAPAPTKAAPGLFRAGNIAKAGIVGAMGTTAYAAKKGVDTVTSLANPQHQQQWSVPRVRGRGRVF